MKTACKSIFPQVISLLERVWAVMTLQTSEWEVLMAMTTKVTFWYVQEICTSVC